jgi:hypothetical protein
MHRVSSAKIEERRQFSSASSSCSEALQDFHPNDSREAVLVAAGVCYHNCILLSLRMTDKTRGVRSKKKRRQWPKSNRAEEGPIQRMKVLFLASAGCAIAI